MSKRIADKKPEAGRGWFRRKDGTCERNKPCPKGTFRINNSDTLYQLCDGPQSRRYTNLYFRKAVGQP